VRGSRAARTSGGPPRKFLPHGESFAKAVTVSFENDPAAAIHYTVWNGAHPADPLYDKPIRLVGPTICAPGPSKGIYRQHSHPGNFYRRRTRGETRAPQHPFSGQNAARAIFRRRRDIARPKGGFENPVASACRRESAASRELASREPTDQSRVGSQKMTIHSGAASPSNPATGEIIASAESGTTRSDQSLDRWKMDGQNG